MSSEQEQIAQGSLKSSHRNTHAAVLKRANNFQSQKAIEFLNSTNLDLVIQQRISSDKAEIPLKKGTFFIQTFITKSEPGFLVFLPNLPAIFVKYNLTKKERLMTKGQPLCYLLRFRVSVKVNEGSIFIASIDTINHRIFLEDIYLWANQNLFSNKTFLERRNFMKQFVESHWMPDSRLLGGLVTSIIQPQPLSSFDSVSDTTEFLKVVLIPDSPNKRRFALYLNETALKQDLENNWAVVAEAIQTILRREGYPKPYESLKELTRTNSQITQNTITEFIKELKVSDSIKKELLNITPHNYTGIYPNY
jgi:hypothetical protein